MLKIFSSFDLLKAYSKSELRPLPINQCKWVKRKKFLFKFGHNCHKALAIALHFCKFYLNIMISCACFGEKKMKGHSYTVNVDIFVCVMFTQCHHFDIRGLQLLRMTNFGNNKQLFLHVDKFAQAFCCGNINVAQKFPCLQHFFRLSSINQHFWVPKKYFTPKIILE